MTDDGDRETAADRVDTNGPQRGSRSDDDGPENESVNGGERPRPDRERTRLDRRTLLRAGAGTAYALGLSSMLGVERFLSAGGGDVEVVTALVRADPDDPWSLEPRRRSVPADWHAAVSAAFELHETLTRFVVSGYAGSSVAPGSYDEATASITLGVTGDRASTLGPLHGIVPSIDVEWGGSLDGVDVTVDRVDTDSLGPEDDAADERPHLVDDPDADPVPGGVRCETRSSSATLAPAVYDPDRRGRYFATASHAYAYTSDAVGEPLYLSTSADETTELGRVAADYPIEDLAIVEPNGRARPGSVVQGASVPRIVGQYTRWGLADLIAREEPLEKVGARTGRSTGRIVGVDAVTCVTDGQCRPDQLKWGRETDMGDGDSGSVSYHPDPAVVDGALVASLNNARTWWPGQNHLWGTAAYAITDRWGMHF